MLENANAETNKQRDLAAALVSYAYIIETSLNNVKRFLPGIRQRSAGSSM